MIQKVLDFVADIKSRSGFYSVEDNLNVIGKVDFFVYVAIYFNFACIVPNGKHSCE